MGEVNWKSVSKMYGMCLLFIVFLGFAKILILGKTMFALILVLTVPFLLPLAYYFIRNRSSAKIAGAVSFMFGMTYFPIYHVLNAVIYSAHMFVTKPGSKTLYDHLMANTVVDWATVFTAIVLYTVVGTVLGIVVNYVVKSVFHEAIEDY